MGNKEAGEACDRSWLSIAGSLGGWLFIWYTLTNVECATCWARVFVLLWWISFNRYLVPTKMTPDPSWAN